MFSTSNSKHLEVYAETNEIGVDGRKVKLTPKEMGVLELLVNRQGSTLTREELLEHVWGNKFGNDQGLTQAVSRLRSIFLGSKNINIITIPKKGYQLLNVEQEPKNSMMAWVKSHLSLLIILLLGVVILILIFVRDMNIRIESMDMDTGEKTSLYKS